MMQTLKFSNKNTMAKSVSVEGKLAIFENIQEKKTQ